MPRHKWMHVDDPASVGRRLREARQAAGLSQRRLAFPGCTPAYISRVEAGLRVPSLQLLRELATRVGVSVEHLATGSEAPARSDPLLDAEIALRLGEVGEAARLFEQALEASAGDEARARALAGIGQLRYRDGRVDQAIDSLEQARALLGDGVADHPALVECLGKAYALRGERELAIAVFEDALRAAKAHDELARGKFAVLLANALIDNGNFGRAQELLAALIADAERMADPVYVARLYWSQSRLHSMKQHYELAARYAQRAIAALEVSEDVYYAASAHHLLAFIEIERGEPERALELLHSAQPLIAGTADRFTQALFRLEEARALLKLGEHHRARDVALVAADMLTGVAKVDAVRAYTTLADILAATGDRGRAIEQYRLAIETLGDLRGPLLSGIYARLGDLLAEDGRTAEALEVYKQALTQQAEGAGTQIRA